MVLRPDAERTAHPVPWSRDILLVALAVRGVWWGLYARVLENEGVEYVRLAKNWFAGDGYVSIFGGTHTLFPPLLPFLTGVFANIIGSAESAARVVVMLAGVILVWAVVRTTFLLFDAHTARMAGWFAALHPVLVGYSVAVYSEVLYLALAGVASVLTIEGIRHARFGRLGLAGLSAGLAYLARPEGAILAGMLAALSGIAVWTVHGWRSGIRSAATLAVATLVVGAPYMISLSSRAGAFRWEGKSAINNIITEGQLRGLTYQEAGRGLSPSGEAAGAFLFEDQNALLRRESGGLRQTLAPLLENPITRLRSLLYRLRTSHAIGGPLIILLALYGLLGNPWWKDRRVEMATLLCLPLTGLVVLLGVRFTWDRYLLPFLPALLICAAGGITRLGRLRWLAARDFRRPVMASLLLAPLLWSGAHLPSVHDLTQTRAKAIRATGDWIKEDFAGRAGDQTRGPHIASLGLALAHYADGTVVYLPFAPESLAVRFLTERAPDYVALRQRERSSIPYGAAWWERGIASSCAAPVRTLPDSLWSVLRVWRWNCRARQAPDSP